MITLVDISRLRRSQLNVYATDLIYNCLKSRKIHFKVSRYTPSMHSHAAADAIRRPAEMSRSQWR